MPYCNRSNFPIVLLLLALTTLIAFGCGKARRALAPVAGKVSYQGQPLRFGTVIFQPESGQYATGAIQSDGTFQMTTRGEGDGVAVGKNRVRIVCMEGQDPVKTNAAKQKGGRGEAGLGQALIPEKYSSCDTSGLVIDVRPGANEPVVLELSGR